MRHLLALALLLPGLAAAQVCGPRIGTLTGWNIVSRNPAATPTFDPPSGYFFAPHSVTISSATTLADVYYSTDGATWTRAPNPATVTVAAGQQTVRAVAGSYATTLSAVASVSYNVPQSGPSYYVDSNLGTDQSGTNTCTSQATPCKTIARVLAVSPPANSTIWLAHGSRWKEEITGLASGVSVRDYGTDLRPAVDSRPKLDASDVVAGASWTKSGGYTNLYQVSWPLTAGYQFGVWENGTRLARVASAAVADTTPGSYYAPILATGGADVLYVHATGSTAVTTNGRTYELRKRSSGITGALGGLIEGIHTMRNAGPNGSLISYYHAKDCLAEDGAKHNFWVEGLCEDCEARYNEPPPNYGGSTLFVTFPYAQGSVAHWGGAKFVRSKAVGVGDGYTIGFYAHTSASQYMFDRIVFDNCSASGVAVGFGGANADRFVLRNVSTTASTTGVSASGLVSTHVLGGKFQFTNAASINGIASTSGGALYVRKAALCQYDGGAGQGWIQCGGTSTLADVKGVTFAHHGPAQFHEHIRITDSCHLAASNNVFLGGYIQVRANSPAVIDSLDSNVYRGGPYPGTAYQNWTVSGTNYTSIAALQGAYPTLETTGTSADPVMVGDLNACDVSVNQSTSPAVSRAAGYQNAAVDGDIATMWASYGAPPITWPTWPYTTPY